LFDFLKLLCENFYKKIATAHKLSNWEWNNLGEKGGFFENSSQWIEKATLHSVECF
jgi:hypothetical protein